MFFLPKETTPTLFEHFRGIGLIHVVAKLYMGSLMDLLDELPLNEEFAKVKYFGSQGIGSENMVAAMQLPRAVELHMAETDVEDAYDNLGPSLVARSLTHARVHSWFVEVGLINDQYGC